MVCSGTYEFKNGQSRSKILLNTVSSDQNAPRRIRIDEEMRHHRIKELKECIQDIDDEIGYKEKRRIQAEAVHDYCQCHAIIIRITALKEKRRLLQKEQSLLKKKGSEASWYKKKKMLTGIRIPPAFQMI